MATNVPQIEFTPTGLTLPEESDLLAGFMADYNAAFGGNLAPALNTPQGQLATSNAAIAAAVNALFLEFVNNINPDTSSGFMQDAIARIYFLTRNPGVPTAVQCDCIGLAGTVIPVGARAQDTSGNLYTCTQAGTIPVGGLITLSFACTVFGPTPCPANTLVQIYQAIPGWDTINNALPGVPGNLVESTTEFAFRRQQSVAKNAAGSLPSIYANVFAVAGVIDVYCAQNVLDVSATAGSTAYPLLPHSIYVGVSGGAAADIGEAIWEKKNEGSNMNGNTTVVVTDQSGYTYPLPQYNITFNILTATPILFAVQIVNAPGLPADVIAQTQDAILNAFVGGDGGPRARAGALLVASRYYAPVQAIGVQVSILSILIGISAASQNSILMGIDQEPTLTAANILVSLI